MLEDIIKILNNGGLIALPTDTIYGVIGNPFSELAVNKVYELKNRPANKKLSVFVKNKQEIKNICKTNNFIDDFIDNDLNNNTIILEKKDKNYLNLVSDDNIGIRVPNNDFIIWILKNYNKPLFATSVNLSGEKECLTYKEVLSKFKDKIDLIIKKDCEASNKPSSIYKIDNDIIIKIR